MKLVNAQRPIVPKSALTNDRALMKFIRVLTQTTAKEHFEATRRLIRIAGDAVGPIRTESAERVERSFDVEELLLNMRESNPEDYEVFRLLAEDYTIAEIAESLGISARAVRSRFKRALARMSALDKEVEMLSRRGEHRSNLEIGFDPVLSAQDIAEILSALADYYRACGGVGLRVDFGLEEAVVRTPVHA
jgi:predicted DNA-binding protein YlxM (UPF0122 family)